MSWRDFFGRDWVLKVISLAFAILLWFFVVGEEKAEVTMSIPLEIVNVPQHLIIANDIPPSVEVRVYGPRSMIRRLNLQRISKVIDLQDASPGEMMVHITADSLPLPSGVRAMRIQPSNITIFLDRLIQKTLPVKPVLSGRSAPYFEVSSVEVEPKLVTISGPAAELRNLHEITTLPVDLGGANETFSREAGLDFQGLHITAEDVGAVKVTVSITPISGSRKIKHVPVVLSKKPRGASWWPREVSVVLKGPLARLKDLKPEDIKVNISTENLSPGVHKVEPKCSIPEGFELVKVIPKSVQVTVPRNKKKK